MNKVAMILIDDLHLEHRSEEIKALFANEITQKINTIKSNNMLPILLCAGDIDEGLNGIKWVSQFDCEIVYTCGNHEFWNQDYYQLLTDIEKTLEDEKMKKIHFLYNSSVIIHGVKFLGGTLWTEMGKSWPWWGNNKVIENFFLMADFRKIKAESFYENSEDVKILVELLENNLVSKDKIEEVVNKKLFNPLIQLRENRKTFSYLKNELANKYSGQTVVVTHHLPIQEMWIKSVGMDKTILNADTINDKELYLDTEKKIPKSKNVLMMGFYVNDYKEDFIERSFSPDLWVHGHYHQALDTYIGKTRISSSPVGHFKPGMKEQGLKMKEIIIDKSSAKSMVKEFMIEDFKNLNLKNVNNLIEDFKTAIFSYNIAINNGILSSIDFQPVLDCFKRNLSYELNIIKNEVTELLNSLVIIENLNMSAPFTKDYYIVSRLSGLHQWIKNNNRKFFPVVKEFVIDESSFDPNTIKLDSLNSAKNWFEYVEGIEQDLNDFKNSIIEFSKNI